MSKTASSSDRASLFWQAKIWGLIEGAQLNILQDQDETTLNWRDWAAMKDWPSPNKTEFASLAFQQIRQAPWIAAASDRGAIAHLPDESTHANDLPLEVSHLFSGAMQRLEVSSEQRTAIIEQVQQSLATIELRDPTDGQSKPLGELEDRKKLAWWLWRCLPIEVSRAFSRDEADMRGNQALLLPAELRLPDASIWSYASITAALGSSLTGYDIPEEELYGLQSIPDLPKVSIATFSFTPVQELIKASRKMRDFWAGSWVLHYLSAKIAWKVAQKYGPDTLLYPSLFQQPLIDYWLLQDPTYSGFDQWVSSPSDWELLTAGFPNVLVFVLPEEKVKAAMQMAKQTLLEEWRHLGHEVLQSLHDRWWMRKLKAEHKTWQGWLDAQWQTYWSSVCLGDRTQPLVDPMDYKKKDNDDPSPWCSNQNYICQLESSETQAPDQKSNGLFTQSESKFLREAAKRVTNSSIPAVNIGSWWPYTFTQARRSLMAVKSARPWTLPTAFGNRSSISGIGPAVHPDNWSSKEEGAKQGTDWIPEGTLTKLWKDPAGTFDGREQLNATEVLKRGLQKILIELFPSFDQDVDEQTEEFKPFYPDLTAGVAGYLKTHANDLSHFDQYCRVCRELNNKIRQENASLILSNHWGIPWIDEDEKGAIYREFNPRYLNAGWLAEEVTTEEIRRLEKEIKQKTKDENIEKYAHGLEETRTKLVDLRRDWRDKEFKPIITKYYPEGSSPADWYVLAAGDGDGMSNWLKGKNLKHYQDYMPTQVQEHLRSNEAFRDFLEKTDKRMGPATHSALSRALLDFSNQLLPHLTEERYAGRLIYGGGDDVLAYSNLWEWDQWLWDVRECFRGAEDPQGLFRSCGDYWRWNPASGTLPTKVSARPLFTMGSRARISFGVVIANQSVPLAIALENLWEAEEDAKKHFCQRSDQNPDQPNKKDAVQVRVLYGNGNILKATAKFDVFKQWSDLIAQSNYLEPSLFEQAAELLKQHPIPVKDAIDIWCQAFCDRRDILAADPVLKQSFYTALSQFFIQVWDNTIQEEQPNSNTEDPADKERDLEMQTWLKLAAFVLRKRKIQLSVKQESAHAMV